LGVTTRAPGHRKEISPQCDCRSRDDRLYLILVLDEAFLVGPDSAVTQGQRSRGKVSSYREGYDVSQGVIRVAG